MDKRLGLYVHLPFCESKCGYCDFPSFAGEEGRMPTYVEQLCAEIRAKGLELSRPKADTVFLGGGTPSLLPPELITRVLQTLRDSFDLHPEAEITCEANPGTLNRDFLAAIKAGGVNRLSLGAQSAQQEELALLCRIHDWQDVENSVNLAREMGFLNLNLDIMSGLPGQTWEKLQATLEKALRLNPTHLSCYSLIIEEDTPFYHLLEQGQLLLLDEETEREMVHSTDNYLSKAGYEQYEISNFAKPGYACLHNQNCWEYADYLGFGLSAASLYQGVRQKNTVSLGGYLSGEAPQLDPLSKQEQAFEQVMLGLRLTKGLSVAEFEKRQGKTLFEAFPKALDKHLRGGLLEQDLGRLRLTPLGFDLMDRVLLDLMPE